MRMAGTLNGSTYTFTQKADMLHEFVALDGSTFAAPFAKGKVDNQNLHGADAPKLVIVTAEEFLEAANKLADYHREHDRMRVLVNARTLEPHEAAIPLALTGKALGSPTMAGLGAHIQRYRTETPVAGRQYIFT
jgi:hypothetical protein